MIPADLRTMVEAATPGPWSNTSGENHSGVSAGLFDDIYIADTSDSPENAALIALAPSLALALVEAWEALEEAYMDIPDRFGDHKTRLQIAAALAKLEELGT